MADKLTPRINIVTLGVHDLPAMRSFYERLGFKASPAGNEHVAFFDANGIVLALFGYHALAEDAKLEAPAPAVYRGFSLAWNADSESKVEGVMAHAARAGARIVKPAEKVFWGGYSGYFADPENNLWEVAHNPFFPFDDHGHIQLP